MIMMIFKSFTTLALAAGTAEVEAGKNTCRGRDGIGMAGEVAHKLHEEKSYQQKCCW